MFEKHLFAARLSALRKGKNVTQQVIADLLQVSKTQICDMEKGHSTTTLEKLVILAEYFDVSTDYLLGRIDNPNSHK